MDKKEFKVQQQTASTCPISYNPDKCVNCWQCVEACQCDVLFPGKSTPVVMYPGECYYCGACVMACPVEGAISFKHPIMNQAKFVEIEK